jgi:hypothetical protein
MGRGERRDSRHSDTAETQRHGGGKSKYATKTNETDRDGETKRFASRHNCAAHETATRQRRHSETQQRRGQEIAARGAARDPSASRKDATRRVAAQRRARKRHNKTVARAAIVICNSETHHDTQRHTATHSNVRGPRRRRRQRRTVTRLASGACGPIAPRRTRRLLMATNGARDTARHGAARGGTAQRGAARAQRSDWKGIAPTAAGAARRENNV